MTDQLNRSDPNTWVEKHGDVLFRYALSRLHNPVTAEDAVQDTMLAAIKSRDRFSGGSSERTWLIGILKHKIVDVIRKESRERPREEIETPDTTEEKFFDKKGHWRVGIVDWQVNPRRVLEQKEFMDVLRGCLSHLPERLRDVFTLRELEAMTTEELCKVVGISSTNLWVSLHRARMRLRYCLQENWPGAPKEKITS